MDRSLLLRSAAIVICAACAAGYGEALAGEDSAQPATDQASANDLPATLDGEIDRAHGLRVKGNFDEAAKALGQLMLVAPDDARVVGEYGKTLVQEGRPADAAPFLRRAIELNASDWSLYSALGVAYDQSDDHTAAKLAYERALSLKPDAPEVLNNFAVSRMLAGDLDGARRLFAEISPAANPKIAANLAVLESMKKPKARRATQTAVAPAPAVLTHPTTAAAPAKAADAPPRALAGVIMQKVPVDPLAGPVAHHSSKVVVAKSAMHHTKLAATQIHRAATPTQPPVLRTAADGK